MPDTISAIILSGGQGSRFDFQDKGLLSWHDKPLISHVINIVRPQVDQIIISCNRNNDHYHSLGYQTVSDQLDNFQGPLAGVSAAKNLVTSPYCLICPCDTPKLPGDVAQQLLDTLISEQADVAYPVCNERHHYLPSLICTETLATVNNYLLSGHRSIRGWYKELRHCQVDFSNQSDAFINVNSQQYLDTLE